MARYVVEAVVLEDRSYREVARAHGVSRSWVGKLVGRFREGGYEAIAPRSRAPKRIPHRTCDALEDEIVALRKELTELGVDAGAATIHYHLSMLGGPLSLTDAARTWPPDPLSSWLTTERRAPAQTSTCTWSAGPKASRSGPPTDAP
jgi:transposase-like protein